MKIDSLPQPSYDQQQRQRLFYHVEEDDTIVVTDIFGAVVTTIESPPAAAPQEDGGRAQEALRDEQARRSALDDALAKQVKAALVALDVRYGDAIVKARSAMAVAP